MGAERQFRGRPSGYRTLASELLDMGYGKGEQQSCSLEDARVRQLKRTELARRVESAQCLRSPHSLTKLAGAPIDSNWLWAMRRKARRINKQKKRLARNLYNKPQSLNHAFGNEVAKNGAHAIGRHVPPLFPKIKNFREP